MRQQKHIRGIAGHKLDIVCTANSGKPPETLFLTENGSTVQSGESGKIVYSFVPSRKDNMKSVECSAVSAMLERPLTDEDILDVQYKPSLTIDHPALVKLIENTSSQVCCQGNSNPSMDQINWKGNVNSLVVNNTISCLTFSPIHRTHTQRYTCVASNRVGISELHIDFKVLSPPIFISTNKRVQLGQYRYELNITVSLYSKLDIIQLKISNHNRVLRPRITKGRARTPDIFHDLKLKLPEITVVFHLGLATEEDFVNYTLEACNIKGCNSYTVYLRSGKYEQITLSVYNDCSVIIGNIVGGMLICSIVSHIYCRLRRKRRSNATMEIPPEGQYNEIGTINYNNMIVDPITNFELDNNDHIPTDDVSNNVISSGGGDSSSASSFIGQTGDGYENPYQAIIPSIIEMHQYSSIIPNIYQNTIISPASAATTSAEHINIAIDNYTKP
ncbi:HMCN [Mytilus coruscus]|uniref:HMCN n=1 Tax=Mytilus coruscus TaxID=42192 RepID=A0A6J8CD48_MYTCO|nr:HMCN [Mytilus coruscus]